MGPIFLVGPPGSGKTVCGAALARLLGCEFHDTDALIEAVENRTVSQIFADNGEQYFRKLEAELLENMRAEPRSGVVFATGGGLPIYNDNMSKMRAIGHVIALTADLPVLVERVSTNTNRPLLRGSADKQDTASVQKKLSQLLAERSPVYEQAGYKIDTSRLNPDQVAHEILRMLESNVSV